MIEGITIRELTTHADDRGYFREVLRDDDKLLQRFGQLSATLTYPGVIKAFHWHQHQDDLWYVASGNIQAVLYDQRQDSATHGQTQVVYLGDHHPALLVIPKGVVHGYRVLGLNPAILLYVTTGSYDAAAPDEERLAFDDPTIGFDWSTKNR